MSFYGAEWGADLAGRTYIYKADEYSQIAEVTAALETQLRRMHPSLTRLGNKELQETELAPGVCYWQIAAVKVWRAVVCGGCGCWRLKRRLALLRPKPGVL